MTDTKATVYEADPHTLAKHQILREYLKRWLPILARQSRAIGRQDHRLLYVDGFGMTTIEQLRVHLTTGPNRQGESD